MARLEADQISNEGNTGQPNFPNGLNMSNDTSIVIGSRGGGSKATHQNSVANSGTLTLAFTGAGPSSVGIICASSTNTGFSGHTNRVYAFGGRDSSTPTQLYSRNDGIGATFSIAHTDNSIIMTNTSGTSCNLSLIVFFGVGF